LFPPLQGLTPMARQFIPLCGIFYWHLDSY
jgi:hypothetical protein